MEVLYMDEFIKMLNEYYELMDYRIKENKVVFEIASNKINCTYRVHAVSW
jgi:hypothetical protein